MAAVLMIWIAYLMFAIKAGPCKETHHCSDCNSTTGSCLTECDTGYYDQICSSKCSDNCMNHKCVLVGNGFGNCTEGCVPGYQGLGCNIPCDNPRGSCTACPGGCDEGYCQLGSSCVSGCVDSSYGTDCGEKHVDPCMDNKHCSDCDNTTGHCITECDTGYFDQKCSSNCSANCKNKKCTLLNTNTGSGNCTDGCVPGYQGLDCNIPCDSPGDGCTACPGGCEEGYCQLGSSCVSGCVDSYFGTGCHEKPGDNGGLFTGLAIGLATSSFLFIVTISLVVYCRYCQRSRRNRFQQYVTAVQCTHVSPEAIGAREYAVVDEAKMYDPLTGERQPARASCSGYDQLRSAQHADMSRDLEHADTAKPETTSMTREQERNTSSV
ncbi:scavenger receptor class F member 1-like [Haliotis cracherodii]|uniref:scavenger receptor class F member 1-like n=1 Tax=Haliotis cracherodii TaxID=6455 RepID=UPI0039E90A1D